MTTVLSFRTLSVAAIGTCLGAASGGCARDVQHVIRDSLAAGDPARVDGPVGAPPVPPEALTITHTGLPPTHTSAVEPDPILPTMDEVYKTRRLPAGAERWTKPATRPADHEGPPEGQYQPDRPPRR